MSAKRLGFWQRLAAANAPAKHERECKGLSVWAKVESVYDGDTITAVFRLPREPFYSHRVRLSGIDAPEKRPKHSSPHHALHKQAGAVVQKRLASLLPAGLMVIIDLEGFDMYGRMLGRVHTVRRGCVRWLHWQRQECVGSRLLKQNLALPYEGKTKKAFSETFLRDIVRAAEGTPFAADSGELVTRTTQV